MGGGLLFSGWGGQAGRFWRLGLSRGQLSLLQLGTAIACDQRRILHVGVAKTLAWASVLNLLQMFLLIFIFWIDELACETVHNRQLS